MKKIQKTVIRKEAIVLLIACAMVFSTIPAVANTFDAKTQQQQTTKIPSISLSGSREDILLFEGFEEGKMPPSGGWETKEQNLIRNWTIIDKQTYPDYVHSGAYAGWINYDDEHYSDNSLISPPIALKEMTSATLLFWAESDTDWPTATMQLWIAGQETGSYLIWDMIQDENWSDFIYRPMVFDLTPYIGQYVQIIWKYVGQGGNSFGLDDIMVLKGTDTVPPVTTCTLEGDIEGDVYIGNVTVTLSATDDLSGVASTMIKIDNGNWASYTDPVVVSTAGDHTVYFYSTDSIGNVEEEKTKTFTIASPANIEIGDITGGMLKVKTTAKNTGGLDATNVSWSIKVDGKLVFLGKETKGQIDVTAGSEVALSSKLILGFGKATILVSVGDTQKSVNATIFLFIIKIV